MINLKNIEVTFGDFKALKDININIKEGEFFTFLGPSGCGKTTTLRTITGFISPSAGTVSVRGVDITHTPIEKRNIGMVFQSYALFPTMTVYENIAFGLKVKKMNKDDIREKVYAMAEKVDLNEEQLQKKVSELSGGQQQRVAIARALVTNPEIICLDEPLSNLDAKLRVQLRNELKDLQKRFGITTVYVTHDQEEALTLSDRIAVFNKGVIEQIGRPDEIYSHSATEFVCNFIGDINKLSKEFLVGTGAANVPGVDMNKNCYIRLERMHVNEVLASDNLKTDAVVEDFEFYGLYIKYSVKALGQTIKVIEKNSGKPLYQKGETVTLSYSIPNAMTADGPAGLRIKPECGVNTTAFPCSTLLACTWNPEVTYAVGEAGAKEVKENNIAAWLTPAVNIHRSPLCGRNFEYYSEDPFLAGTMAAAMVRGIQSQNIAPSVKHFALNNKETNRKNSDSRVSERAAREIYLKVFEIIVKTADPWFLMSSYNVINGHRASECRDLLEDILRDEWGFNGAVTTDWWTYGEHYKEVSAGNDLKMACGYPERLMDALDKGILSRHDMEKSAKRILTLLLRFE